MTLLEEAKAAPKKSANDMDAFMSAFNAAGLKDLASYIRPIPEKYEGPNVNYHAVLMSDPKRSALHIHAVRNDTRILKAAIQTAYIDPRNSNMDTPFHVVAHMRRPKVIVDFFIKHGADINAKNNQGNTPLHLYILAKKLEHAEHLAIIEALLEGGAKVDALNRDGLTPLGLAVQNNVILAIEPLVRRGAMNHIDAKGNTPLHLAIECQHLEVLNTLLMGGWGRNFVNSENSKEETPLILAVRLKFQFAIAILVTNGADVNRLTSNGWSAMWEAEKLADPAMLHALKQCGARPPNVEDLI